MRSLFLIVLATTLGFSQCPTVDFTIPASACKFSDISSNAIVSNAVSYYWDFCDGTLQDLPTAVVEVINPLSTRPNDFRPFEENNNHYIISVDYINGKLFRYEFGASLSNEPDIFDLGNFGVIVKPLGIELWQESNEIFALVVTEDGSLFRMSFGGSIQNLPSIEQIMGINGLNDHQHIRITQEGGIVLALIAGGSTRNISVLNFGSSILNYPVRTFTNIPAAVFMIGIEISIECNARYALVSSYGGGLFRLDFGNSFLNTPSVASLTSIPDKLLWGLSFEKSAGEFYAFIFSDESGIVRVDFGNSLNNPAPSSVNLGFFNGITLAIGLAVLKCESTYYLSSMNYSNGELKILKFPKDCSISTDYSNEANPLGVSYQAEGIYFVTLTARGVNNERVSTTKSITINNLVAPILEIQESGNCVTNGVTFTGVQQSGEPLDTFAWYFGDGATASGQGPTHNYAFTNTYDVKLEATSANGCANRLVKSIPIYNEPSPNFNLPTASPVCSNQEYLFNNTSTYDLESNPIWSWEVNGGLVSNSLDLLFTIPTATMQDIKLIASIPGCSSEVTKTINTVEDGPLADFSFVNDCEDKSITFTNTTVGTVTGYSWDFGDGNTSGLTNGANTFDDFGTYDVTLEATNAAGCINTSVQEITIYSKPQPDFSLDLPPFSCNGSPSQFNDLTPNPADSNLDSWAWSFGDTQNGTSIIRNPQYIYADAGQYNVNLDVTTNFGCTASVQKMVTISQTPDANFSFNAACVNQGTSFVPQSASGIDSWQWKVGTSTYNQQNPTHVFSSPATYNAQLTANGSNGCIGVASQMVNVPVPSVVDFSFENNCTNQDTQFTDLTSTGSDPVSSRLWQFGSLGSASGANPSFSFPTAGSYPIKLTVINQSGCSYSTTKIVNITQSPIATFTATPQTGTAPLTVQLNNTSPSSISQLWTANDPTNATSTTKTASFTFDKLGEYVVDLTIEDESGCTSVSSKIISVIIPTLDIELTQLSLMPSATGESNILLSLTNKSNFPVNNIKAIIDISGEALISETITATIQPNEVYSQILSTGIIGSKNGTSYLCVELVVDGDADIRNNKKCLNNDAATVVMAPYPNPGSENLNLEWISTEVTSAEIHIFDPTGRKVYEDMFFDLDPGLNHATISLGQLNPGMYYVFFVSEGVRRSFPFVISR